MIKLAERFISAALQAWRDLSLDAKVVSAIGTANWLLLFANHTTVAATRDVPLWQLFPFGADIAFLVACGVLPFAYAFRDHRSRAAFTTRQRAWHVASIVAAFVVLPTLASIVLRETGKPYTYIHDGALMVEWAARKLLLGQNPYVADYLDTPLYYWPMVNNPALYHLTYFPFLFLVTTPFVWLFDKVGLFWDQRYLYAPAYIATLAVVPLLARRVDNRLALVALIGLNPQLFPFVVEGRNDFFVLLFLFAGIALLQRDRRTLGPLAIAVAAAVKLHAVFIMPFIAVWLVATRRPRTLREAWDALWRPLWPADALPRGHVPAVPDQRLRGVLRRCRELQRGRRRVDVSDLRDGLLCAAPRARRDPVPAGGLPVRRDRGRRRDADRALVDVAAVEAADPCDAADGLRADAARVPLLRPVLPGELPRLHPGR